MTYENPASGLYLVAERKADDSLSQPLPLGGEFSFRHPPICCPLQKISNRLEGQDEPQKFSAWVRVLN